MDIRDVCNVGSDIMDAVNEAVGTGDFSGLNETLRTVTGTAAGSAADALHGLQGHLQGDGGQPAPGQGQRMGGADSGNFGHARRSSGSVTEEYMQRVSGARHHTKFASRISPFLQRQVSRSSGIGSIVGGVVSLVFAGYAFLLGMVGSLFSFVGGAFTAWTIISLVIVGGLAVLGGILIKKGQERRKLVHEYYEYGKIAGTAEYVEIGKLARAMGESRETVLNNLEKMISEEMLPAAWFDRQKTTLMLSEDLYNEYLRLERERQEQEAEAAKEKMRQDAQAGTGEFQSAAAAEGLPEDLRLTPEDEKLPADAKKIVEEGLLYIGRIRAFNDAIPDEEISGELLRLEVTMRRILDKIRKDPAEAPNLRRLMVYYLPTTMKLLQAYRELDNEPAAGANIVSTKKEIREALGTINVAFDNLLDSLYQDMAWDIASDISVMKTMMAQDGLTGQPMRAQSGSGGSQGQAGSLQESFRAASQGSVSPAENFDSYTEGFTEGLAEEGTGAAAYAQAPLSSEGQTADADMTDVERALKEKEQGIRLTFGE